MIKEFFTRQQKQEVEPQERNLSPELRAILQKIIQRQDQGIKSIDQDSYVQGRKREDELLVKAPEDSQLIIATGRELVDKTIAANPDQYLN